MANLIHLAEVRKNGRGQWTRGVVPKLGEWGEGSQRSTFKKNRNLVDCYTGSRALTGNLERPKRLVKERDKRLCVLMRLRIR
jgi:hypothetical protein